MSRTIPRTEILAGVTTFLTMSYIAVVNPSILATEGTGLAFSAVMTATVVVSALASILMGLWARLPYGLAPGMGLNAFVTYTLILGEGMSAAEALGAVVVSGAVFVALSATSFRTAVARAIPATLRQATAGGIGLFLVVLGLRSAGVIVDHPVTLVAPGEPSTQIGLMVAGVIATAWMVSRNVPGAFLIGMVGITALAQVVGINAMPETWIASPDFSLVGEFDVTGVWTPALIGPVLTLLLTDLLDSLSTLLGISHAAGLVDERGEPVRLGPALVVDAVASLLSGVFGTSPATTYVESAAGIREGGRTGVTAVVTGLCFVPLLFLAPLAAAVPAYATAPTLVIVGGLMLQSMRTLPTGEITETLPALLTLILIPMTFSITQGIVWGILAHLVFATVRGRAREIPAPLWVVGTLCALVLIL